jgi:hypothetical protein
MIDLHRCLKYVILPSVAGPPSIGEPDRKATQDSILTAQKEREEGYESACPSNHYDAEDGDSWILEEGGVPWNMYVVWT